MMKKITVLCALMALTIVSYASSANARMTYATWVRHGDAYMATGKLAGETQSFRVKIVRKGNRFIVRTPLGDHALSPQGSSVVFKVRIKKSWARIIWNRQKATIRYNNQTGNVSLRRASR